MAIASFPLTSGSRNTSPGFLLFNLKPAPFPAAEAHKKMKTGFVNIFGQPNAGKSTLLNALMGEKLAIVSSKVQTTRHRIKAIMTEKDYQVVISDTPGIIEPRYKLHEKMMQAVKGALEDSDVALLIVDVRDKYEESNAIFEALKLKVPAIVVINKIDLVTEERIKEAIAYFEAKPYCKGTVKISATSGINIKIFPKPSPASRGRAVLYQRRYQ